MSPLAVWGLSLGCAVGWGAFMVPANLFIPTAGPLGTIIAMTISTVLLLIIAANFCHLAERIHDDGGIVAYTKRILGHDHAFLAAWILLIAYLSIMWGNATANILLARFLLGDVFAWGYMYNIAGFDINFGEILITWLIITAYGLFSIYGGKLRKYLNTLFAVLFFIIVVMLFIALYNNTPAGVFTPGFQHYTSPFMQVFSMVMLAPWMFFGFETVTHASADFTFPSKRLFPIVTAAVVSGGIIYVLLAGMAVMNIPEAFSSWTYYIAQKNSLEGLDGLPVFHSVHAVFGNNGLALLCVSITTAISTSLLGLFRITGVLLQYMAVNKVLPPWFAQESTDSTPRNAIFFVMLISLLIPFLGRVSVVWLCDVITVVGSVAYGYASLCAYIIAWRENDRRGKILGAVGVIISILFFFAPLIPGILLGGSLDTESYLMLACWSMLGFVYYWYVFKRDQENRFGHSTSMCIMILFLNFFSTSIWMHQTIEQQLVDMSANNMKVNYTILATDNMVQMLMILIILLLMADIFITIKRRERITAQARKTQHQINQAKNTFLSNLSHDIRIPMEAAQASIHLALENCSTCLGCPEEKCPRRIPDRLTNCLSKLDNHNQRLMNYIDCMLDKGCIEDGNETSVLDSELHKILLDTAPMEWQKILQQTKEIFALQMQDKNLFFEVYPIELRDNLVLCDERRLTRILINLISNACEYTAAGGGVMVTLLQTGTTTESPRGEKVPCGVYELHIQDTGTNLPPVVVNSLTEEFYPDVTDMGGLYIARGLTKLLGGTLSASSMPGQQGKELILKLILPICSQTDNPAPATTDF